MHNRNAQLAALFLREANFALRHSDINDTGLIVTFTGSELTKDGKDLFIYFSVLGEEEDRKRMSLKLESFKRDIRNSFKKRLRIKIIPNLFFRYDATPDKASKVEEILLKIRKEEKIDERDDSER